MPVEEDSERRAFTALFGGRHGDASMPTLARSAARAGYTVIPLRPGGKKPLCPLTKALAVRADRAAAHAARDAGRRNWKQVRHPCGITHATTDWKRAHARFKRLEAEYPNLNIAVDGKQDPVEDPVRGLERLRRRHGGGDGGAGDQPGPRG
jgi:hypothetical protein